MHELFDAILSEPTDAGIALIENGADLCCRNDRGENPLELDGGKFRTDARCQGSRNGCASPCLDVWENRVWALFQPTPTRDDTWELFQPTLTFAIYKQVMDRKSMICNGLYAAHDKTRQYLLTHAPTYPAHLGTMTHSKHIYRNGTSWLCCTACFDHLAESITREVYRATPVVTQVWCWL
jgi:hypothetical protein